MTVPNTMIGALVEAIFNTLARETDEPEDGMIVIANLVAFMYIKCGDGSSTLEDILAKLCERVVNVVAANEARQAKPTGDTIQ
jgi:class 3 adenylate cyclase